MTQSISTKQDLYFILQMSDGNLMLGQAKGQLSIYDIHKMAIIEEARLQGGICEIIQTTARQNEYAFATESGIRFGKFEDQKFTLNIYEIYQQQNVFSSIKEVSKTLLIACNFEEHSITLIDRSTTSVIQEIKNNFGAKYPMQIVL